MIDLSRNGFPQKDLGRIDIRECERSYRLGNANADDNHSEMGQRSEKHPVCWVSLERITPLSCHGLKAFVTHIGSTTGVLSCMQLPSGPLAQHGFFREMLPPLFDRSLIVLCVADGGFNSDWACFLTHFGIPPDGNVPMIVEVHYPAACGTFIERLMLIELSTVLSRFPLRVKYLCLI